MAGREMFVFSMEWIIYNESVGDWKITADERARFDIYFQQCGPVQGYLTGRINEEK